MVTLAVIVGMALGVLFLTELRKYLSKEFSLVLVMMMFVWDAIVIYAAHGYAEKEELALGIMIGTLIKCYLLIRQQNKTHVE